MAGLVAESLRRRIEPPPCDWDSLYRELLGHPPYPKQVIFHTCPAGEILYGGAAGGAKSTALLLHYIGRCWTIPGYRAVIFRRTYPELEASHIAEARRLLTNRGPTYKDKEHRWYFPNGSTLDFRQCEHEKEIEQYNSAQWDGIAIDELRDWTAYMYRYLLSRLRTTKVGVRTEMRVATNPGGIAHGWIKAHWIAPPRNVAVEPPGRNGEVWQPLRDELQVVDRNLLTVPVEDGGWFRTRAFIFAKITDNPVLMARDPQYLANLLQLPEPHRSMLLEGNWDVFVGQAFPEWNAELHTCPPHPVPDGVFRFRALDWGLSRPYSIGWYYVDYDGRLWKYRECYGWGGQPNVGTRETVAEVAARIHQAEEEDRAAGATVEAGPADASIFAPGQDGGPSIAERFAEAGIVWLPADKSPQSRIHGKQELHRRLRPMGEGQRPGLVIFRTCVHTIRTFAEITTDPTNLEDVDKNAESHAYDETRYAVMHRASVPIRPVPPKGMIAAHKDRLAGRLEHARRRIL